MHRSLDVAYVDTAAAQLCLSLAEPPLPALAEITLNGTGDAGATVSLRLLGASHQVVVSRAGGTRFLVETVACLPGNPGGLPTDLADGSAAHGYRFRSSVRRDSRAAVETFARGLAESYEGDGRSLVGHYAADPAAVTAVVADLDQVGNLVWQSWHTYPQSGEIVCTATTTTIPGGQRDGRIR